MLDTMLRKLFLALCLLAWFAKAQTSPEILDIEPPIDLPEPLPWRMIALTGCGLLIAISAILFFRRTKEERIADDGRSFSNAHELALKSIDALDAASGEVQLLFDDLESILRGYIHARFDVAWPQATVDELNERLKAKQVLTPGQQTAILNLLEICEAVRFGGYRPSQAEVEKSLYGARTWIEETRLRLAVPTSTSLLFGSGAANDVAH